MYRNTTLRRTAAPLLGLLVVLSGCAMGGNTDYTTVNPDRGTVERRVEDTGTVTYGEDYTIVPLVGGKVLECAFSEGDSVEAGDVLYVIDSGDLEDQITQALLSLSTAQAGYAQAQAACADLTVTSPASGTVTALYVHKGDFVSTGTPVADLVDSYHLTLTVPFSVADAASFTVGSAARISFSGTADTVSGTVKRIYDAPSVLSGGRSGIYVEISFLNPGAVDSGTAATATVGSTACMEAGAVAYGTQQSIYASQSGQVLTLPIQVGSAVSAGDTVATLKNDSLTNAVTNAALSVESAQVSLSQLEDKREDYTVTAPVDGVILSRTVKTGDLAAAGSPMATLAQPEALCVHADIDEQYID